MKNQQPNPIKYQSTDQSKAEQPTTSPLDSSSLPPLAQCIANIKAFSRNRHLRTDSNSKQQQGPAETYSCAVALLCHLKVDQETLFRAKKDGPTHNIEFEGNYYDKRCCPPDAETPCIKAITTDLVLLNCLLAILSSTSTPDDKSTSLPGTPSPFSQQGGGAGGGGGSQSKSVALKTSKLGGGRKRSHSVSAEHEIHQHGGAHMPPKKMTKLMMSPKAEKVKSSSAGPGAGAADFFPPVFAAAVLFNAFRHMDHWPASFIRAYAQDSFGPRTWVDDNRCKRFVENLRLCVAGNGGVAQTGADDTKKAMGQITADFYEGKTGGRISPFGPPSGRASPFRPGPSGVMGEMRSTGKVEPMSLDHHKHKLPLPSRSASFRDEDNDSVSSSGSSDSGYLVEDVSFKRAAGDTANGSKPSSHGSDDDKSLSLTNPSTISRATSGGDVDSVRCDSGDDVEREVSMSSKTGSLKIGARRKYGGTPKRLRLQEVLDLTAVRQRYFGTNRLKAFDMVSDALNERMSQKTKQNSGLIGALTTFTGVPNVRSVASRHLEKWMQSPALSGLARTLFQSIVGNMENIDPPLPEDVQAIDSILPMKLKANQFGAHIENVISIVRTIPTLAVAQHIFLSLLREQMSSLTSIDAAQGTSQEMSDTVRMIAAVASSLSATLAANGLGSALLKLLSPSSSNSEGILGSEPSTNSPPSRDADHVFRMRLLVRNVVRALGNNYDGHALVRSILTNEPEEATPGGLDDVARIVFELLTLMASSVPAWNTTQKSVVPSQAGQEELPKGSSESKALANALMRTRKIVLAWCVGTYFRAYLPNIRQDEEARKILAAEEDDTNTSGHRRKRRKKDSTRSVGAGPPDFTSVLDGDTAQKELKVTEPHLSRVLATTRSLLFLKNEQGLRKFLTRSQPNAPFLTEEGQHDEIQWCRAHGTDVDDETLRIVLNASSGGDLPVSMAFSIIEDMLFKCRAGTTSRLIVSDSELIWSLYSLTEYKCKFPSISTIPDDTKQGQSAGGSAAVDRAETSGLKIQAGPTDDVRGKSDEAKIERDVSPNEARPRLAYPGFWWRATAIAMCMCGSAPKSVGDVLWESCPTLRALIKMSITGRYRFPTVDCDEGQRELMKKGEADARDIEAELAVELFVPKAETSKVTKADPSELSIYSGSRVSARQREKQARLISRQREKEEAEAQLEAMKVKRLAKDAQKTIMLLDPRGRARKPPKDAVNLILSVNDMFGLSDEFLNTTKPDFLVKTFDCTSRESIERAYDWLIPVISSHPGIIHRLPPGAACFLLLRAYGTDGESNSDQLLELAAPLLKHVQLCLTGELGEPDALSAADLLLADVADKSPDRRRCARRVLQGALDGRMDEAGTEFTAKPSQALHANCGWLFDILEVNHAAAMIPNLVSCVAAALAFERGGVLRAYVLALQRYTDFAMAKAVTTNCSLARTLCNLLSTRAHVCSVAMDRFPDYRDLALTVVHRELESKFGLPRESQLELGSARNENVLLRLPSEDSSGGNRYREAVLPRPLLQAAVVLVSNWRDDGVESMNSQLPEPQNEDVRGLTHMLLHNPEGDSLDGSPCGAAGATFLHDNRRAVTVEEWTLLAKSRCAFIARSAALSAPVSFLPRLLLCCGLPRSSFTTMLVRLGKLGESAESFRVYKDLLSPSATSEWGVNHFGNRRALARKLLSRISAYLRYFAGQEGFQDGKDLELASASRFISWLTDEYKDVKPGASGDRSKKKSTKKGGAHGKSHVPTFLHTVTDASSYLSACAAPAPEEDDHMLDGSEIEMADGDIFFFSDSDPSDKGDQIESIVEACFAEVIPLDVLETSLEVAVAQNITSRESKAAAAEKQGTGSFCAVSIGHCMLKGLLSCEEGPSAALVSFAVKWIPLLSQNWSGSDFWGLLFSKELEARSWSRQSILDHLMERCSEVWSEEHIVSCQDWILHRDEPDGPTSGLSLERTLRFLLVTSEGSSPHQLLEKPIHGASGAFLAGKESALSAVSIALKSMEHDTRSRQARDMKNLLSRNEIPDCVSLILLVADAGKDSCQAAVRSLLECHSKVPAVQEEASAVILRLYAYHPYKMSLGDAKLRQLLLDGANAFASSWTTWRSPFDGQVNELLVSLSDNFTPKLQQAMADIVKHHPLLIARKFSMIADMLFSDAMPGPRTDISDSRGRIYGLNERSALARTNDGAIRVKTRLWGDSFTEHLWVAVLQIIGSLPAEVLAHPCSTSMGLLDVLSEFLRLIVIQSDLSYGPNTSKVRAKLTPILNVLQHGSQEGFGVWMDTKVTGVEYTVREILLRYRVELAAGPSATGDNSLGISNGSEKG